MNIVQFFQNKWWLFAIIVALGTTVFVLASITIENNQEDTEPTPVTRVESEALSQVFQQQSDLSTDYPQSLISRTDGSFFIASSSMIWDGNQPVEVFSNAVVSTFVGHAGEVIVNTEFGSFFIQDGEVFSYPIDTYFVTPNTHPQFGDQYIFARIDGNGQSQVRQSITTDLQNSRPVSQTVFLGSVSKLHFILNSSGTLFQVIVDTSNNSTSLIIQEVAGTFQTRQVIPDVLAWQAQQDWLVATTISDSFAVPYEQQIFSFQNLSTQSVVRMQVQLNDRSIFGNLFADRCDVFESYLVCVVKINGSERSESAVRDAVVSFDLESQDLIFVDDSKVFSASAIEVIDGSSLDFVSQTDSRVYRWDNAGQLTSP